MAFVTSLMFPWRGHHHRAPKSTSHPHASIALPPRRTSLRTPPPPPPQPLHVKSAGELALLTSSNAIVVLKVYSQKCRSCRKIERPFAKLAQELSGRIACTQLCAEDAQELAQELGVRGFPTFIVWKGGERVDHFSGNSADVLREEVEAYL